LLETLLPALATVHVALLVPLALLGLHRGLLVLLALRARWRRPDPAPAAPAELPRVTVQLPIFNERYVVTRLIEAAAALDWPRDRLQIQVLDDSTDDTSEIVRGCIARLPRDLAVQHLRRDSRRGFKAGALAAGLQSATGELIAIFDADFVPPPQFLRACVPQFQDPTVGAVQGRWEHLNPDGGPLPGAQAGLLDGHFAVEHVARSGLGCFFNFNGTAGVLRRRCIEDAGGWQHDTLTEDLDLSYRAQLRGWRFVYLPDLACPAELPPDMASFLNQQHRWAKGAVQTGVKLWRRLLSTPIGLHRRVEATVHLFGNLAFPLLVGLILVALPLQSLRAVLGETSLLWLHPIEALPIGLATLCVLGYYGTAQLLLGRGRGILPRALFAFVIGAGLAVNNTIAALSALRTRGGEFERTPKQNVVGAARARPSAYRSRRGWRPWLELSLGTWAATTATISFAIGHPATGAFHSLFAVGLLWAGAGSILPALIAGEPPLPLAAPLTPAASLVGPSRQPIPSAACGGE
jgi:cellulose synthase/poly-beta-1,6-N-acetylglucosamine synthase-like glycosyltransferase